MNKKTHEIIDFLSKRRSTSYRNLVLPIPDDKEILSILKIATRSPDYGALEPWRFLIFKKDFLTNISLQIDFLGKKEKLNKDLLEKQKNVFLNSPLIITVIFSPKTHVKISRDEQLLSTGGVCLALLNACNAYGWGANWLTGWTTKQNVFLKEVLGLSQTESVAGYIHVGTVKEKPLERKRPTIENLISWM